jgi:hypothetical protein
MLKKGLFLLALAAWGLACSNEPTSAEGETTEMHEGHDH